MKHILTVDNGKYPIILEMHESTKRQDRFKVTYGLDVEKNLNYHEAAQRFGFCYFHMLACEGKFEREGE